jgi:cellulose biosynthesis protein BcsQ
VAPDNTGKNLKKELEILKANIIIVDLPPAIESLSLRAALYSDLMLVPVGASILDIDAAKEAIKVCEEAKDLDSKKNFLLIPTKIQPQTLASKELVQVLSKWGPVAKSHISLRVAFADAALNGMGIGEYAKGSLGAKEIHSLAKETINLIGVKNDKNN